MLEQQQALLLDLASTYRELYRARFRADVQAGTTKPFIVPLHLFAIWIVPTLYLAIPHINRPWLYHARWLVLAFVCAFHGHMIKNVSSLNFASGYGAGLIAAWGTIWNFTLLVWTRPQWDARRVERRKFVRPVSRAGNDQGLGHLSPSSRSGCLPTESDIDMPKGHRSPQTMVGRSTAESGMNGATSINKSGWMLINRTDGTNGVRKRETLAKQVSDIMTSTGDADNETEDKLIAKAIIALNGLDGDLRLQETTALKLARLARELEYEYFWQEYPADAPFWTRLSWSFDIVSSFRLTGWNWAPSCLPRYEPPPRIGPYQLPLEYGTHRSRQGYERTMSRLRLVLSRWFLNFLPCYAILDLCATLMTTDPYFIAGPGHGHPLPPHLAALPPVLLSLQRTLLAFVGIYFALQYTWNAGAIVLALYCPPVLGFRAHPWHLPSMTGSFMQVLDHGLSGFWGAWWHQSFRVGFAAPTKWLLRHGYLPPSVAPLVGAAVAFVQSGLVHAAGSYTSVPATHYWNPPIFFALSGLGTLLQTGSSHLLRRRITNCPHYVRRLGNFAFVFFWLWATAWLLLDDFGRCGIWLWEPVPISFVRAAGFGADRRIWRWDRDSLPRWQWGAQGKWWETGITI